MKAHKTVLLTMVLFIASISLFAQTAEEWKELGNVALDSANYNKAIEYYQKAIESDSNYFDAYYNLGLTFTNIHEFDKAIEYYNIAISKNDTVAEVFFALGDIYAEKEDYSKAIDALKKGIELKPDSPGEHYYLGFLYQAKGSLIYATMYAKKAAQLGDTLAQQYFISNGASWEDDFLKPDYEQIKLNIENRESDFFYAKLWDKYQQGDTTMTQKEKRYLYYGYVFHKNYSPYSPGHNAAQINAILNKEKPTTKEWKKIVSLLDAALTENPFSCRNLYYQSIAYNALNKPVDADKNINKIHCIVNALTSTGDGLSKETAIHVIAVSNEYDYLFVNNLSMRMQSLINGGYDVLYLNPNEDELEEMWFDVNQSLNYLHQ